MSSTTASLTGGSPAQLYRQFLRVIRSEWPFQQSRTRMVSVHVIKVLRTEMRRSRGNVNESQPTTTATKTTKTTTTTSDSSLENGQKQLDALRYIVSDKSRTELGIASDSPLKAFLPPAKQFTLLDDASTEALSQKNNKISFWSVLFSSTSSSSQTDPRRH